MKILNLVLALALLAPASAAPAQDWPAKPIRWQISCGSPEAFGELLKVDYAKYARIIRETGLKAQ